MRKKSDADLRFFFPPRFLLPFFALRAAARAAFFFAAAAAAAVRAASSADCCFKIPSGCGSALLGTSGDDFIAFRTALKSIDGERKQGGEAEHAVRNGAALGEQVQCTRAACAGSRWHILQ